MLTAARPADTPGAYADEPPSRSAETTTYSISAIGAQPNEELAEKYVIAFTDLFTEC
jgi:hypothetical protein